MALLSVPLCISGYVPHDYILDSIAHAVHISSHLAYVAVCCQKAIQVSDPLQKIDRASACSLSSGIEQNVSNNYYYFFCWWSFSELQFLLFDTMTGCWLMVIFRGHVRHFQNCMVKTLSRHPHCFGSFSLLTHFYVVAMHASTLHLVLETFMIKLWNHGLLDARSMNNCNMILEHCQSQDADLMQS
ncbi:hypothetical protein C3L33_03045, partial [Rhododendron williamsianum]